MRCRISWKSDIFLISFANSGARFHRSKFAYDQSHENEGRCIFRNLRDASLKERLWPLHVNRELLRFRMGV